MRRLLVIIASVLLTGCGVATDEEDQARIDGACQTAGGIAHVAVDRYGHPEVATCKDGSAEVLR